MNKMVLFLTVVFLGVITMLVLSNQGPKQPKLDELKFSLSPSPQTQQPQQQAPPTTQPSLQATEGAMQQEETTMKAALIRTSKGDITIQFFGKDAARTVANFATKAKTGFYNNLSFHRVEDWVIQGGDPKGNGTGGGNMATELNDHPFIAGSVGVARGADIRISNDAQFFITKKDSPHLNGQYTNFGAVVQGMDVVEKIEVGDKIVGVAIE